MQEPVDADAALVVRLRAGDERAFERLVRAYQHRVFAVACRMLGNPAEAEDLAQEVFLRVHRSIGSFRGEAKLSTWLYAITSHLCLNRLAAAQTVEPVLRDLLGEEAGVNLEVGQDIVDVGPPALR